MRRYFLREISVEGFRGINNEGDPLVVSLEVDRVNSIFAPNGSGKSSLFEALEYAFRGGVSRLNEMQAAEAPEKYVPNLFHSQKRATIRVSLEPDDGGDQVEITISREEDGERVVASSDVPNAEEILASMDEDFALLDYNAFNKFIEDTALERGRSFSSLLGLSEYGEFLRVLKGVSSTQAFKADFGIERLDADSANLNAQVAGALEEFTSHYRTVTSGELKEGAHAQEWSRGVLESLKDVELLAPSLKDCSDLNDVDFSALKDEIFQAESGELRKQFAELKESQTKLSGLVPSKSSSVTSAGIERLLGEYIEARANAAESELQSLLLAASRYFHLHEDEPSVCPLCERDGLEGLPERVDARLERLAELEGREAALRTEVVTGAFARRLGELEKRVVPTLDAEPSVADELKASVDGGINLTHELLETAKSRLVALEGLLSARLRKVKEELERVESTLPPSLVQLAERVSVAEVAKTELNRYLRVKAEADTVDRERVVLGRWRSFINDAHRIFANAESEMSKRILSGLRTQYQEVFASIMSVNDVVPSLTRASRNEQLSVELSNFHGEASVSARAVLSESYRNALAISVFLSAAARHGKAPRFVVLDDVTSSFDAGHQFRLMEQLRTRLQYDGTNDGLQVILLSHDVTLEKYFDRLDDGSNWNHQKLQGWPPITPVTSNGQSADRLRVDAERHLRAGRMAEGSGLIRQYLEFVLQQIIRKLRIPVPIDLALNDHAKMVGSCLDAIVEAVELRSQLGTIVLDPQQVSDLRGRHVPAIIANWVSHYGSTGSAVFSPASLLAVLGDVDAIRRCFQYDESGTGNWRFYRSLTKR